MNTHAPAIEKRSSPRRARTRMLDAAEREFSHASLECADFASLARRARASEAAIAREFSSRAGLYEAVACRALDSVEDALDAAFALRGSRSARYRKLVSELARVAASRPARASLLLRLLLDNPRSLRSRREFHARMDEVIARIVALADGGEELALLLPGLAGVLFRFAANPYGAQLVAMTLQEQASPIEARRA
jgi:AcrR family transcriptional regulator